MSIGLTKARDILKIAVFTVQQTSEPLRSNNFSTTLTYIPMKIMVK